MVARAIVNYGVYKFTEEQRSQYSVRVTAQIERKPDTCYENLKYQQSVSFYGYAQFMIEDWVALTIPLENEYQQILEWSNDATQNEIHHACTRYSTAVDIADGLSQLGASITVAPIIPVVVIPLPYDRVLFKLFSNATLLVEVTTEPFVNICDAPVQEYGGEPVLSEPSNRDVEPNSEDSPYDVPDPPYDEPTADNGETYNPQRPEPTNGEDGQVYAWFWQGRILLASEPPPGRFYRNTVYVTAPYSNPQNEFNVQTGSIYRSTRFVNTPAGRVAVIEQDSGSPSDVLAFNADVETFGLVT